MWIRSYKENVVALALSIIQLKLTDLLFSWRKSGEIMKFSVIPHIPPTAVAPNQDRDGDKLTASYNFHQAPAVAAHLLKTQFALIFDTMSILFLILKNDWITLGFTFCQ